MASGPRPFREGGGGYPSQASGIVVTPGPHSLRYFIGYSRLDLAKWGGPGSSFLADPSSDSSCMVLPAE